MKNAWHDSDDAPREAGPILNWTRLKAEDIDNIAIVHTWQDIEGLALDIGLLVRPVQDPSFITMVPWHRVAWVRWAMTS